MLLYPLPNAARSAPVALAPTADRTPDAFGPLRRPASLIRAGRAGAALYRRERHLRGVAPSCASPRRSAREVAVRLAALEGECEELRRTGAPDYSVARHVLLLSALLAERAAAVCGAAA